MVASILLVLEFTYNGKKFCFIIKNTTKLHNITEKYVEIFDGSQQHFQSFLSTVMTMFESRANHES